MRKAGNRVRVTVQLIDAALRPPRLGRALRPRPRGHLRDPGRGDRGDRRDAARADRGGDATIGRSASRPRTWRPTNACSPARCCTTARRARTMSRRSACWTGRSSSTRNTPMPTPGRPACSARPGSTAGARIARRPSPRSARSCRRAGARRQRQRRAPHPRRLEPGAAQHDKAMLPPGAGARPQSQQRPDRRAAGRASDLARPAGGGHRLDQARDAAQPLSSRALLEPPRPGLLRGAALRRGGRRPSPGSARPTTRTTRSWPPPSRRWAMRRRRRAHAEEVLRAGARVLGAEPISRRCTTSARATASTIARACSRPACRPSRDRGLAVPRSGSGGPARPCARALAPERRRPARGRRCRSAAAGRAARSGRAARRRATAGSSRRRKQRRR